MSKLPLLRSLLVLGTMTAAFLASAGAADVGKPAPDFTIKDIDGKEYALSALKGKTVVLEWVNPDCPFVQKHYNSGNMPTLQKDATADGVVWLTINSGHPGAEGDYDKAKIESWLSGHHATPTAYFRDSSGKLGHLYDAKCTPHMYVINPEGTLVYQGAIDSIRSANPADVAKATNYVKVALEDVKDGKPVAKPSTEAYGCSVKY